MSQNLGLRNSARGTLPRGKACMTCRRRKIKCDGQRPKCDQCLRSPGTDRCKYAPAASKGTRQFEETTNKLGLPEPTANDGRSSMFLREPCDSSVAKAFPQFVGPGSDAGRVARSSNSSSRGPEEPPIDVVECLVDVFLENVSQVGFFLDAAAFRHSALLDVESCSHDRPLPSLMSAVYMWGARFSAAPRHPVYNEDAFLVCALQNIHNDLGGNHPHRVMHGLQAEILLSFYYLALAQPVEGMHHSSAAVSLALSAGLHLINAPHTLQPCFGDSPGPPSSVRSDAERISAFWTVVIVNNYWVVAYGSPSMIPDNDTAVDAPWPLNLDDYVSSGLFDATASGGGGVSKLLSGLIADGFSPLALHSKASMLLERAITFSATYADDSDYETAFDFLDTLLEQFMLSLPLGLEPRCSEKAKHRLLVTQTLVHTAVIRLHALRIHTSDESRRKYMTAALTVVHIISNTNFSGWRTVDPIMGILWTTVCEVFVGELANLGGGGGVALSEQYRDLTSCLQTVLFTMRAFAVGSPLTEHFCARVEEAYGNTLMENSELGMII
ncbi:hypothetical protein DFH06DRAFT_1477650 [Mycena polygramma]|nr:hypothetical protein DFH06DRAFT_1477650 [Mycena polygramma]